MTAVQGARRLARRFRRRAAATLGWATGLIALSAAGPASACGLALALAIDVSSSVSRDEYALQTQGHAVTFRDPEVLAAIRAVGGIAVTVLHWSGEGHQEVIEPWTLLETAEDVAAFANRLETAKRRYEIFGTALGSALGAVSVLMEGAPPCQRRAVDVSGDGISNAGLPVAPPRERLLAQRVVINGLVVVNNELVEADPVPFYQHQVIGGPGSFMMIANDFADYPRAFREKLLREIGLPFAGPPEGRWHAAR